MSQLFAQNPPWGWPCFSGSLQPLIMLKTLTACLSFSIPKPHIRNFIFVPSSLLQTCTNDSRLWYLNGLLKITWSLRHISIFLCWTSKKEWPPVCSLAFVFVVKTHVTSAYLCGYLFSPDMNKRSLVSNLSKLSTFRSNANSNLSMFLAFSVASPRHQYYNRCSTAFYISRKT